MFLHLRLHDTFCDSTRNEGHRRQARKNLPARIRHQTSEAKAKGSKPVATFDVQQAQ